MNDELRERFQRAFDDGTLAYKAVCMNEHRKHPRDCDGAVAALEISGRNNHAEVDGQVAKTSGKVLSFKYRSECATPLAFFRFDDDGLKMLDAQKAFSWYDPKFVYGLGKRTCVKLIMSMNECGDGIHHYRHLFPVLGIVSSNFRHFPLGHYYTQLPNLRNTDEKYYFDVSGNGYCSPECIDATWLKRLGLRLRGVRCAARSYEDVWEDNEKFLREQLFETQPDESEK